MTYKYMMKYHALIYSSRMYFWERSSGAHRIATYLRRNDMDIEVVDFAAHWDLERLKEFTRKSVKKTTIFFGFSTFFSYWNQTMIDFSYWLKSEYPHIKTVAGGQSILDCNLTNIDIWIDSFAEEAILAVARSLSGNTSTGLKFSVEHFGTRKVIKALDTYPSYNLRDYGNIHESRDFLEPWEWLTIEFSRGCKFACAFCNFPILGVKEDTSRSKESFEYEMKYNYDNFGIDRYYVADETFNDRIEKITKFADVVDGLNFDPFFSGFIRADLLSVDNMIPELARMNFGGQYYGVETFNKKSGVVIGKGLDPDKVQNLILNTKQYFKSANKIYKGTISLIVGLPYDTQDNWEKTDIWLTDNWMSEGLVVFPLGLGNSESTNQSKFAQNLKKYGLREISEPIQSSRHLGDSWKNPNYSKNELLWEHDTMNIFQAREIADKIQLKCSKFSINSWGLSWPEIRLRKKIQNLNEHIHIPLSDAFLNTDQMSIFINSYIVKKLQ